MLKRLTANSNPNDDREITDNVASTKPPTVMRHLTKHKVETASSFENCPNIINIAT